MSLSNPPSNFFRTYKQMILQFLWGSAKHTVRYSKIIQNYHNGGLKLVDLEAKMLSLKAKWPLYFANREEKWFYPNSLDHQIWQSNTNESDAKSLSQKYKATTIFQDIWCAWTKIFFEYPTSVADIAEQKLWGNSCIRRANKPFTQKVYLDSYFDTIYQMRHETENRLITYEEFKEIYGPLVSMMEFNSLKVAIPVTWKKNIKVEKLDINEKSRYEIIELKKSPTKDFYWQIIEREESPNLKQWEQDIGKPLDHIDW